VKDTARRILAAAIPCFAAKGKKGTTTRDVAGAAGVNVATLAYHFGGKDGLYTAAVTSLYEQFLQVDPEQIDLSGEPRERIEQLVRLLYQLSREHRTEVRLLHRHVLEHGSLPALTREGGWTELFLGRIESLFAGLNVTLPADWRLRVLSLSFLLARYAVSPEQDLAPYFPEQDAQEAIETHLARLASSLLLDGVP